jgi:phosphonate transport system substrate-binding protein
MNDIVEIWRSKLIPEGPMVVRRSLPAEAKAKMTALLEGLWEKDPTCAYNVAAGEAKDFVPVTHEDYLGIIAARKLQEGK